MEYQDIFDAIENNDIQLVKKIISKDKSALDEIYICGLKYINDLETAEEFTPLMYAVYFNRYEIIKFLIEQGCSVNESTTTTPLHMACLRGNEKIIKLLIEHGANLEKTDSYKITPLHYTCIIGNINIVKLLIQHGANVNVTTTDEYKETPLYSACERGYKDIAELLIQHGANIQQTCSENLTPLSIATIRYHIDTMELLVNKGADPEKVDNNDNSILHIALSCFTYNKKHGEIMRTFIEKYKINVNTTNKEKQTPLHYACINSNCINAIKMLIQYGADVNAKDEKNKTPLHYVCEKGNVKVIKLLLQSGADVNVRDEEGKTPLYYVFQEKPDRYIDIAKLLLQYNAEITDKIKKKFSKDIRLVLKQMCLCNIFKPLTEKTKQKQQRIGL